jgi:hypothetical protein
LFAKIFAVKLDNPIEYSNHQEGQNNVGLKSPVYIDVGLKGNDEKPLVNSYCIFSGLKFKTTSYNHDGCPFYLIISIYQGSINTSRGLRKFDLQEAIKEIEDMESGDGTNTASGD